MDFQIIVLLAFGLVSLLNALAKKRKAREAAAGQTHGEDPSIEQAPETAPTELEVALDEIRLALGMGAPTADTTPASDPDPDPAPARSTAPRPPQASPPPRTSRPASVPAPAPASARTPASASASDEFHRVLTGQPDAEPVFKSKKREWKSAGKWNTDSSDKPSGRSKTREDLAKRFHQTEEAFQHDVVAFADPLVGHTHANAPEVRAKGGGTATRGGLLSTPDSLRKAVVVSMVLGSPRSKTPYKPRNR